MRCVVCLSFLSGLLTGVMSGTVFSLAFMVLRVASAGLIEAAAVALAGAALLAPFVLFQLFFLLFPYLFLFAY